LGSSAALAGKQLGVFPGGIIGLFQKPPFGLE
jgi:hypothetical protein